MFKNKKLLIVGGTGSFGKAMLIRILKKKINFKEIRIFSRDEKKQDDMRKEFNSKKLTKTTPRLKPIRQSDTIPTTQQKYALCICTTGHIII